MLPETIRPLAEVVQNCESGERTLTIATDGTMTLSSPILAGYADSCLNFEYEVAPGKIEPEDMPAAEVPVALFVVS